jgi:hypothetical protein
MGTTKGEGMLKRKGEAFKKTSTKVSYDQKKQQTDRASVV